MAAHNGDKAGDRGNEERAIRKWIDAAQARIDGMHDMLDAYGGLLVARVRTRAELEPLGTPVPDPAADKLARGVPLLVGEDLGALAPALALSAGRMAIAVAKAFPALAEEAQRVGQACNDGLLPVAAMAEALLGGDEARLGRMADAAGVRPGAMAFMAAEIARPVLQEAARALDGRVAETGWLRGQCPVCGAQPDVAVFRPLNDDNEYLKNYGGQRWLHCPHCATQWRFRRHVCPSCANEDNETLSYYSGAAQGERADVCRKCGRYMVGLDVREFIEEPDLDVAALAMLPLDILVQREGFTPLARTFWNTLD